VKLWKNKTIGISNATYYTSLASSSNAVAATRLPKSLHHYCNLKLPPPLEADPAAYILQALHYGEKVPECDRSGLSGNNVCCRRCQHWVPVPTFSTTWWPDCTTHQDVKVPHSVAVSGSCIWNTLSPAIRQSTTIRILFF